MAVGNPKSRRRPIIDLYGQTFGRWTVLEFVGTKKSFGSLWNCRCECGTKKVVDGISLRLGRSKSCGCLSREMLIDRTTTHGLAGCPEYKIWNAMKQRCMNPNTAHYADYGGRGITVCKQWQESFEAFFKDVGQRPSGDHSIDRIDVNGNYEPTNVRWVRNIEQKRNMRRSKMVTYNGKTMCVAEWAHSVGLTPILLNKRIIDGWDFEKALRTPQMRPGRRKAKNQNPDRGQ